MSLLVGDEASVSVLLAPFLVSHQAPRAPRDSSLPGLTHSLTLRSPLKAVLCNVTTPASSTFGSFNGGFSP